MHARELVGVFVGDHHGQDGGIKRGVDDAVRAGVQEDVGHEFADHQRGGVGERVTVPFVASLGNPLPCLPGGSDTVLKPQGIGHAGPRLLALAQFTAVDGRRVVGVLHYAPRHVRPTGYCGGVRFLTMVGGERDR